MYYVGNDEGMIISSSGISNTLIASSAPDIPVITNKSPFFISSSIILEI